MKGLELARGRRIRFFYAPQACVITARDAQASMKAWSSLAGAGSVFLRTEGLRITARDAQASMKDLELARGRWILFFTHRRLAYHCP
ncbi:hypothetical protein [Pendulispora albinea]|uniref:Uncharacterized protein n=1 Tax=Pendulispora albinea TaxID=2741071 RepID=A0ABZ2M1C1_9BACT